MLFTFTLSCVIRAYARKVLGFRRAMESDKDHIHLLIKTKPNTNISRVVNKLKSYTTYHAWKQYDKYLNKLFWLTKSTWIHGYFVVTVGNVSADTVAEYIKKSRR